MASSELGLSRHTRIMSFSSAPTVMPDLMIPYLLWSLCQQTLIFFIDFEERDYEERVNAVSEGEEPRKRRVPTSREYGDAGGMYKAYALRGSYNTSAEKQWGAQRP
jgi:hypothetical protein